MDRNQVLALSSAFFIFCFLPAAAEARPLRGQARGQVILDQSSRGIEFENACVHGKTLTIAAVGDVLLHSPLQIQAYSKSEGHFSLWKWVAPMIEAADIAYANLEGPIAPGTLASGKPTQDPGPVFDDQVYTSYPQFNYHPSLASDLVASGFDVVSTANNHSLDRRVRGVDLTIESLRRVGLSFTGTRASEESHPDWYTVVSEQGFSVAFLACTYATNGIADSLKQVFHCYRDETELKRLVRELSARRDLDAVIVTPHWGVEYTPVPEEQEVRLGRELLEAGATAVIGSHPHVLQPWEKVVTRDGREGFIIYSLGNFVSGQSGFSKRSTVLLYLGLTRSGAGKAIINGVRYVPLYMGRTTQGLSVLPADRTGKGSQHLEYIRTIFGDRNRAASDERVVTNPQCH